MLEVKIPKEIMDYQEKFLLGLSIRKIISLACAISLSIFICQILSITFGLSLNSASYVAFAISLPVMAVGFIKIDGYNFEKYASLFLRHYFANPLRMFRPVDPILSLRNQKNKRGSDVENTITRRQEKKIKKLVENEWHP
ncbi:MAG: PrgI family protein [Eubacteriaceae bacterium]|nr:PrgI family protein [Eubacteriaceae bacterium]